MNRRYDRSVSSYEGQKERMSALAQEHNKRMLSCYTYEIRRAVEGTVRYTTSHSFNGKRHDNASMKIIVDNTDSVSAIFDHTYSGENKKKTAILNFASYKNPGGMFLEGSRAQEECLCHASYLYNVLDGMRSSFYDWNNRNKNKGLYMNRALYSPDVAFFMKDAMARCDVITCAAPNKKVAQRFADVSDVDNYAALESRINFVLSIAEEQEVHNLILGAYGCGVFGQDPAEVAEAFKAALAVFDSFDKVIFAIPRGSDGVNLNTFRRVFTA